MEEKVRYFPEVQWTPSHKERGILIGKRWYHLGHQKLSVGATEVAEKGLTEFGEGNKEVTLTLFRQEFGNWRTGVTHQWFFVSPVTNQSDMVFGHGERNYVRKIVMRHKEDEIVLNSARRASVYKLVPAGERPLQFSSMPC